MHTDPPPIPSETRDVTAKTLRKLKTIKAIGALIVLALIARFYKVRWHIDTRLLCVDDPGTSGSGGVTTPQSPPSRASTRRGPASRNCHVRLVWLHDDTETAIRRGVDRHPDGVARSDYGWREPLSSHCHSTRRGPVSRRCAASRARSTSRSRSWRASSSSRSASSPCSRARG